MFAWRLFLATGDVRYPDVIERTLFNVVATSPSADGRAFFYANPLHQREAGAPADDGVNTRAEGGVRAPWFEVSCCPTNVARTLASLASYLAAVDDEGLILLQYAAGEVATDGWRLRVASDYPDAGSLTVTIDEVPAAAPRLRLRIPAWADGATVAAADAPARAVAPGWYDLPSVAPGDVVILTLPNEPRLMFPDARIDAVRGSAAIERGPLVLCAESLDLPDGVALEDLRLLPLVPRAFADGARARAVVVEAPAGSIICWHGNTWHGAFRRKIPGLRLSIGSIFSRPYIWPRHPLREDVTQEILDANPPRFAKFCGRHVMTNWREDGPVYGPDKIHAYPTRFH